jgi:hypothetical protein
MPSESTFQYLSASGFRHHQIPCSKRVKTEEVTMRTVALGRTGASVASLAEVIRPGVNGWRGPIVLRNRVDAAWDVPQQPVIPGSRRCIRVIHD